MKKISIFLMLAFFSLSFSVFSQDKRALRAAELSYSSAESEYKKGDFKDAASKFEIVVSTISESIDSRKHQIMRLESLVALVDIYLYKYVNIEEACKNTNLYFSAMNKIRNSGVLKGRDLLKYLEKEKDFAEHQSKCESYRTIGTEKDEFRKRFDEEMKERE